MGRQQLSEIEVTSL